MRRLSFLSTLFLLLLAACTTPPAPATTSPTSPATTSPAESMDEKPAPAGTTTGTPQLIEFYADW